MTQFTARRGLPQLEATDLLSSYPSTDATAETVLDQNAMYLHGGSPPPAANSVVSGTFYYATDLNILYCGDGTNWNEITQNQISAPIAIRPSPFLSNGTIFRATDTNAIYICDGSAWHTIAAQTGNAIISSLENTSSSTFTLLPTPDRVSNIFLPSDGLIEIYYQAQWTLTNPGSENAQAAIFIGSNLLLTQANRGFGSPPHGSLAVFAHYGPDSNGVNWRPLCTFWNGLTSLGNNPTTNHGADVTSGQVFGFATTTGAEYNISTTADPQGNAQGNWVFPGSNQVFVGGPCQVFAAAGTYDVSVQFNISTGTQPIFVQNRQLYVRVIPFS